MKTHLSLLASALLSLVLATAAPAAGTTKSSTWPDTNAGRMAKGWVEAFSAGEPAMRKFLGSALTADALEKKPMDERMETYRTNREKYGKLAFGSVVSSKMEELSVKLIDEDGKQQEFTFVVQASPPYKLKTVMMKQNVFGGHFGHH